MKRMLTLCLFASTTFNALADATPNAHARRYKRQLGLQESEIYYVPTQVLKQRYSKDDKTIVFPLNRMYNTEGAEVKLQTPKGANFQTLTCFETMREDIDTIFAITSTYKKVTVDGDDAKWAQEHVKPVYASSMSPLGGTNIFVYYPAGMPFIKGKYKRMIENVRDYQSKGEKINLYFVIVEVFRQND